MSTLERLHWWLRFSVVFSTTALVLILPAIILMAYGIWIPRIGGIAILMAAAIGFGLFLFRPADPPGLAAAKIEVRYQQIACALGLLAIMSSVILSIILTVLGTR